jgi:hypothetical protein
MSTTSTRNRKSIAATERADETADQTQGPAEDAKMSDEPRQPARKPRARRPLPPEPPVDERTEPDEGTAAESADSWDDLPPPPGAGEAQSPLIQLQPIRLLVLIGGVVLLLLAGGLVFSLLRVGSLDNSSSLRSSALKAANTYGVYLSSYDYHNLTSPTSDWSLVDKHADAKFRQNFDKTSATLKTLLTQYNAVAVGKVISAGLSSVNGHQAVALLFIDQTVTNTVQKPNSVSQPLRVELTMVREHGQWLIDNLTVPK